MTIDNIIIYNIARDHITYNDLNLNMHSLEFSICFYEDF